VISLKNEKNSKNENILKPENLDGINDKADFPYHVLDVEDDTPPGSEHDFHMMHWHKDLQFILVLDGTIKIVTLYGTETLHSGEAYFLNADVVHCIKRVGSCHFYCFIFPSYFLKFYKGSPVGELVDELTSSDKLETFHFRQDSGWQSELLHILSRLSKLERDKESRFYHYGVLTLLVSLWLVFSSNLKVSSDRENNVAAERVRKVLRFIGEHYMDYLSLSDLAKSANISKSECTRCFRQCLNTTPYQYLIEYRLSKAADMLKNTDLQIGEISLRTGFLQMSHFGRYFKEKAGMSPREYRKATREE
jgi:AraC-like DNA-binding protein